MREESPERRQALRHGYTTGACATAASLGAARVLLGVPPALTVPVTLPRGDIVEFRLDDQQRHNDTARAGVIKDAGDDPDVTHGALIRAEVALSESPGVRFYAGPGVGTVTRPGLPVSPGEPAINPVPRRMMVEHLLALAGEQRHGGGFDVTIGVDGGQRLAERTMNPRLGIVGGLSILGTTGIVRPYSCAAYIASIHQAIDVARASGLGHIAACTGSTSEAVIRRQLGLSPLACVEMGDFAGAVLKYLRRAPVARLSVAGGFAKVSKLAHGHLNLHSRRSSVDFSWLAAQASALGADTALCTGIRGANTTRQVLEACRREALPLGDRICALARDQVLAVLSAGVAVDVWATDSEGHIVGMSGV